MGSSHQIKNIAIIGAGPTGLATAKYLLSEKSFARIDVFEQRNHVGGVWNYTPPYIKEPLNIPQTDPNKHLEDPFWLPPGENGVVDWSKPIEPVFTTPLYDRLESNIPNVLMQYSDKPFPADSQLFPKHGTVTEYLNEYAHDIRHLISFQTQVVDVRLEVMNTTLWTLTIKDLPTGKITTEAYDAVVVANGHYTVPYVPPIVGIEAWNEAYPNAIVHVKYYRSPDKYRDKKVLVVGNSASGLDIGAQIGIVCKQPLFVSQRSESYLAPGTAEWKEELPEIAEFLPPGGYTRAVRFTNGRVEKGIDGIVFATGYFYSFPFLQSLQPPLIDNGTRTLGVYKHFIYIEHPSLVLPVLNQKIIPFPLAENQAAVVARVWSGRLNLTSKEEMRTWEKSMVAERGSGKDFHLLGFPADVDYMNDLHDWSMQAATREDLENGGKGKEGPRWGERERWVRERFPAIKKSFGQRGEERYSVRRIEELGYDFDAWRAEREKLDASKKLL